MSNEQLLFTAGNAATAALKLTQAAWAAQILDAKTADSLEQAARQLHCAAVELAARARGVTPPRTPHADD